MFHALTWFVVFSLFALWSMAAWAFHALAMWTLSNADVVGGASTGMAGLRVPDWVPPDFASVMASVLAGFMPAMEAMLQWVPALAGVLSVGVWVIWAFGSAFLLGLGALGSGFIVMLRRRAARLASPIAAGVAQRQPLLP